MTSYLIFCLIFAGEWWSMLAVYIAFRVIKILDLVFVLEEGTIGCELDTHSKTSSTFSFFSRL